MKNFWERYWKWSDKINVPFQKNKDRILLYITLCQSVIITVALFGVVSGRNKMEVICYQDLNKGIFALYRTMTQDDKQALREFLRGAGSVGIVFGAIILLVCLLLQSENPPVETQSTKVVGTYKECDIIQWHYGPLAEYKYFLHCPK